MKERLKVTEAREASSETVRDFWLYLYKKLLEDCSPYKLISPEYFLPEAPDGNEPTKNLAARYRKLGITTKQISLDLRQSLPLSRLERVSTALARKRGQEEEVSIAAGFGERKEEEPDREGWVNIGTIYFGAKLVSNFITGVIEIEQRANSGQVEWRMSKEFHAQLWKREPVSRQDLQWFAEELNKMRLRPQSISLS